MANTGTSLSHVPVKNMHCTLCGIFSAISVLLATANSDDTEIWVPDGSRSLKVTPVNS